MGSETPFLVFSSIRQTLFPSKLAEDIENTCTLMYGVLKIQKNKMKPVEYDYFTSENERRRHRADLTKRWGK